MDSCLAEPFLTPNPRTQTEDNTIKKLLTAIVLLALTTAASAQGVDAAIESFRVNLHGTMGSSVAANIHASVSQVLADVEEVWYTNDYIYIKSSGVPSHSIGGFGPNPNTVADQNYTFRISRNPTRYATGLNPFTNLGAMGVSVNGVPIFNTLDAFSYNGLGVWFQDAVVAEAISFDAALGHPAMAGNYHYHQQPIRLREQMGDDGSAHSKIIAFAFDGYPVYGPYGYTNPNGGGGIKRMESSFRLRNITQRNIHPDGTVLPNWQWGPNVSVTYPLGFYVEDNEYVAGLGDLDAFNGRTCVTPEYPGGTYAYFTTIDANGDAAYPYFVGPWYYGNPDYANISGNVNIPAGAIRWDPSVISTGGGCGGLTLGSQGSLTSGSSSFSLVIENGPSSGAVSIFVADEIAVAPQSIAGGCNLWLGAASATNWIVAGISPIGLLPLNSVGSLIVPVMLSSMTSLSGLVIDLQLLAPNVGAANGFVVSNALSLAFP